MGRRKVTRAKRKPTTGDEHTSGEGKANRRITGRDLALVFVTFFLMFGFIGYLRGRSVRNKPDRLRWDILARLVLGERKGQKVLAYQCNGKHEVAWDIDKDGLFTERVSVGPSENFVYSPAIFDNDSLMAAFLTGGGVASIFTAREVMAFATASGRASKLTNESHIKLIAVAVIATVSGYEIGYQIALHANSVCDDSRFTPILNDAKNWTGDGHDWEGFEKVHWKLSANMVEKEERLGSCNSPDLNLRTSEERKFAAARAEFLSFSEGDVMAIEHNMSAADFDALNTYRKVVREFNQLCRTNAK